MEWISVKDRLPCGPITCIIYIIEYDKVRKQTFYHVDAACFCFDDCYIDGHWSTFNDWDEGTPEFKVTHWMPLPEPPKD